MLTLRDVGYDSVFIEARTEAQHDPTFGNICHRPASLARIRTGARMIARVAYSEPVSA